MKVILIQLFLILTLISCGNDNEIIDTTNNIPKEPEAQEPELNISPSNPPFTIDLLSANFYEDISYNSDTLNVFDFFMPNDSLPSSLLIYIHGGGFVSGDKSQSYTSTYFQTLINNLLSNNVAVATVNYRFVETNDTGGILKSLNDSKRALQFMRYYANSLGIQKDKVVVLGSSAGGGTALWLGFNDDMANANSSDSILRESTRIQGLISTSTQSNYDFLEWHNNVFSEYQVNGFNQDTVVNIMSETTILKYYGVSTFTELSSTEILTYRAKVDMLQLMSSDDPEFYISNRNTPYNSPTNTSELYHHPLHLKALQDKSIETNALGIFYSPELGVDTRNGENLENFILRKIGN